MMDIMLFLWLLVLLACVVYVDSYSVSVIRCEGRLCLYKFGEPYYSGTWQESYDSCVNNGMKLLTIDNQNVQDDVERLLYDESSEHVTSIWIAGRGSSDSTWRYMNDSVFIHTVRFPATGTEREAHCVRVTFDTNTDKKRVDQYINDQCYEKRSTAQLVCQYDPKIIGVSAKCENGRRLNGCIPSARTATIQENGHCDDGHLYYGDKCYIKTQYDGRSDQYKIDWFNAETYCNGLKADIIYSNIEDLLKSHQGDLLNTSTRPLQLWIGVRRYKWYWETDSGATRKTSPIRYYNWKNNEGGNPDSRCIYIDHNDDDKWNSVNCGDYKEYFICTNTTTTATTSTTGTTRITRAGRPSYNSPSEGVITESPTTMAASERSLRSKLRIGNTAYISAGICALLVVAAIIGLTVFFVKKRKRRTDTAHDVNERYPPSTSGQPVPDGPVYVNVMNDQDKTKSPGDKKSSKDQRKLGKDVEVPPSEQPDTARPVMMYKQAPSGDLYATVEKNDNGEGKIKHIITENGDLYAVSLNKS